jgi:6,7-dimethyl-8-ribityllumazine synthase
MSTIDSPIRPDPTIPGPPPRLLIIQAPYYERVVAGMREGAMAVFKAVGASVEVVDVAGAFELPAALRMALSQRAAHHHGFLILGCVVKGDTDHYDHICREACRGIMEVAIDTGAAIGFGLLTVHTLAQALERAAADRMNKGTEAAHALLGQVALRRHWGLA